MGTAKERHLMTENYLAEIKSRMGNSSLLEENDMKMLHMNAPLGDWREWRTLTYDHNVLADWLVRENEDLLRIKKDLEMKIQQLSGPPPDLSPQWPNPPLIGLRHHTRSLEVEETRSDDEEN